MKITLGILAHVDAGKTTFSEALLYHAHSLRAMGRVDHQDAFLDAHPLEKERGITIFSDQAIFHHGEDEYFLVDTPGHVDFAAEMERALAVLDYAVLVVSCAEGVQSHTETIWNLLRRRNIPTFVFLNKVDRVGADADRVLEQMRRRLSADCVAAEHLDESVAERDEALRTIEKTRYLVPFEGHTLEIDVFPFWNDRAFCECELQSEDEPLPLPDWLHVYREVTDDPRYTNRALARSVPDGIL